MNKRADALTGEENELGRALCRIRTAKDLSLRQVEQLTEGVVSNAYLSQLERGVVKKPSPHILSALAEAYDAPYETVLRLAGYLPAAKRASAKRRSGLLSVIKDDDLTDEEQKKVLDYIGYLRSQRSQQ